MSDVRGTLDWQPARDHPELLGRPVRAVIDALPGALVAEIDPTVADTAAFGERYRVPLAASANCVVIAGRRGEDVRYAAAMVLATMRADVNSAIRKWLGTRKASFAPHDDAVRLTGMEYGGITPVGLPEGWPVLVDDAVVAAGEVVIGSGIRGSKLLVPGPDLLRLPGAQQLALAVG